MKLYYIQILYSGLKWREANIANFFMDSRGVIRDGRVGIVIFRHVWEYAST